MNSWLNDLVARHSGTGLLVDANILLLFCVGRFRESLISEFKRTRLVLTDDARLSSYLVNRGLAAINFNHLRQF